MTKRRFILITFPFLLILGIYALGPTPEKPVWDPAPISVPTDADGLEKYVAANEAQHKLKPDNEARIVWADSTRSKTPFSVVYIHGFSASQGEGDPVHKQFAKTFGCNLYLARMADHGVDTTEQLLYFTPDRWWKSSKEALAIGKALGEKVIIMSTSTGGTMALILASYFADDVYALVNMSPNIELRNPLAWVANNPWGLQIARINLGGDYNVTPVTPGADSTLDLRYWNHKYRLEAVPQLQELLESKMNRGTFEKVRQPSLSMYYFKSELEQDEQVKVSAIIDMNGQLATPDSLKVLVAIPNAGGHVLGSSVVSKDIDAVNAAVRDFAITKLKMVPRE